MQKTSKVEPENELPQPTVFMICFFKILDFCCFLRIRIETIIQRIFLVGLFKLDDEIIFISPYLIKKVRRFLWLELVVVLGWWIHYNCFLKKKKKKIEYMMGYRHVPYHPR